jgi:phytoene synthase
MVYDLNHNGFESFRAFLRYAEGAAVAPASVFMHLCGVQPGDNGYSSPEYDIRKAARELALFSYIVHIIRDFQKDQLQNLNYFADDLLAERSLKVSDLVAVARGGEIGRALRDLIRQYRSLAEYYCQKARRAIDRTAPSLQPRYRLSLEIIYGLYLQIFERIDPDQGRFTGEELNPSPEEVQARINNIVECSLQPRNP